MKRIALGLLLAVTGCAHSFFFTGDLDQQRISRGDVYYQQLELIDGKKLIQMVYEVPAPPSQILNMLRDIDSYPTWNVAMALSRVVAPRGREVEVEMAVRQPPGGHRLEPLRAVVRVDAEKMEWSLAGYENEWSQSFQAVLKIAPIGDGSRSLVNYYQQAELKPAFAASFGDDPIEAFVAICRKMQQVAPLPQYAVRATPPAALPESHLKVAVPELVAEGVPAPLARTLTRVFAERLMHQSNWEVSTPQEIAALLAYSQQQQLLGCDGTGKCAVDLGKAMGADRLIVGSLGLVGSQYVVTMSAMKIPEGIIERRVSRDATEKTLLESIRSAADELSASAAPATPSKS